MSIEADHLKLFEEIALLPHGAEFLLAMRFTAQENRDLQKTNKELMEENERLKSLEEANDKLKQLLNDLVP